MSFFDYGCGLGDDLRGLSALGYSCSGWDPVHKKDEKKLNADVVNVGFVLNVIENPEERIEVLHEAYNLTKKLMVVTTLLTNDLTAVNPTPFKDGGGASCTNIRLDELNPLPTIEPNRSSKLQ